MALLIGIVFLIVAVGLVAAALQTRRQAASIPGRAPGTVVGLVTRGPAAKTAQAARNCRACPRS